MSGIIITNKETPTVTSKKQNSEWRYGFFLLSLLTFILFLMGGMFLLFWRWFIVPLGVKDITYWHSMALLLVWYFLKIGKASRSEASKIPDVEVVRRLTFGLYQGSAFFFVLGWLLHLVVR